MMLMQKGSIAVSIHFGEHLMVDGYDGNPALLNSKELVLKCLKELPKNLGMKTLSSPQVFEAPDNGFKDPGGWSGFVVISESHISVHTFPKRGFISADIYTCKNGLNTEYVIKYLKDIFKLKDVETNFVKRGTRYPQRNLS